MLTAERTIAALFRKEEDLSRTTAIALLLPALVLPAVESKPQFN